MEKRLSIVYVMICFSKMQVLSAKNIKLHLPDLSRYGENSSKRDTTNNILP